LQPEPPMWGAPDSLRCFTKDLRSYFVWLNPEAGHVDPTMESRSVNGQ